VECLDFHIQSQVASSPNPVSTRHGSNTSWPKGLIRGVSISTFSASSPNPVSVAEHSMLPYRLVCLTCDMVGLCIADQGFDVLAMQGLGMYEKLVIPSFHSAPLISFLTLSLSHDFLPRLKPQNDSLFALPSFCDACCSCNLTSRPI
jgi:hypothetical protein